MLNDLRHSRCPLCGDGRIAALGEIRYALPVRFSSTPIELERVPELWRCRACGSGFVQNVLPEAVARELYGRGDSTARWPARPIESARTAEVVAQLAHLCTPGARVLDVGANAGDLLDFARARGCITAGAEHSAGAREELQRRGHAAHPALEAADGAWDLITAFDVIEHLYDAPAFLSACRERLRPGGRLLVLTGDIGCASARLAGARWWYAQYPEHIVFPSRTFFFKRSGLRAESLDPAWAAPDHPSPWLARLLGTAGALARGRYVGVPALGPDHLLATLRA